MTILFEERLSDSPYVESVITGYTAEAASTIRPAESRWHMVFTKRDGGFYPLVVGAHRTAGVISYGQGAELLWIKFRHGTYLPNLTPRQVLGEELQLPNGAGRSFWLKNAVWQFPNFENADTFVDQLVRDGALTFDPVVSGALRDEPQDIAPRTMRHRFLHTTGLTQTHIRQIERAQQAANLLRSGFSILDAVEAAGYFDQPHLTRALKQWVGYTPAQIVRMTARACQNVQDAQAAIA
jgi:hypothetical protein